MIQNLNLDQYRFENSLSKRNEEKNWDLNETPIRGNIEQQSSQNKQVVQQIMFRLNMSLQLIRLHIS